VRLKPTLPVFEGFLDDIVVVIMVLVATVLAGLLVR